MSDINKTATELDAFVKAFSAYEVSPKEVQVRPSGDDVDVIKVWVDLGTAKVDPKAWGDACEEAIAKAVPDSASFRVVVRVETET